MGSSQKKIRVMPNNGSSIHQHPQIEGEDRLSSLPKNLLITILSLLPINSAAATSALSRHWRHLWTHMTHLLFHFPLLPFESAVTLIDHIFSQLKSSKIHTFDLQLSAPHSTEIYSSFLVPWFDHICRGDPEVISVNLGGAAHFYKIPSCLFQTKSLVQLDLCAKIEFNYDSMSSVEFSYLKRLHLTLQGSHIDLISGNHTFLKNCPVLSDLRLDLSFAEKGHIVNIPNPSLKILRLIVRASQSEKFVIDAPNLEYCNIVGELTHVEFVNKPCNLQGVKIWIRETFYGDDNDYMSKILGLIRGISCVRLLVLHGFATYLLDSVAHLNEGPMFRNLVYLSLSYNTGAYVDKLPACFLLGKLRKVDIVDVACNDVEINMVKHILSNATVLESLRVFAIKNKQLREHEFCKKLFMLSKSSVSCLIKFFGTSISTSSEHFRDGALPCQIEDHQHSDIGM